MTFEHFDILHSALVRCWHVSAGCIIAAREPAIMPKAGVAPFEQIPQIERMVRGLGVGA
jgi:hypothetical protein